MAGVAGNFGVAVYLGSSGVVKSAPGVLFGFLCSASSSGTVDLYDSPTGATGTHFVQGFPVTAGNFSVIPVAFANGLYATLANCSGTFVYM
jgi:hypothetical protein